ncbi:hypothetical protein BLX87_00635 [Bacillus sp. VT-16-64]|nr:hypothetical protein BLX87_00635 [Bacillus sp. VT-16-64]
MSHFAQADWAGDLLVFQIRTMATPRMPVAKMPAAALPFSDSRSAATDAQTALPAAGSRTAVPPPSGRKISPDSFLSVLGWTMPPGNCTAPVLLSASRISRQSLPSMLALMEKSRLGPTQLVSLQEEEVRTQTRAGSTV